ncbi:NAD(P)-dependent dehydrogenase (short-subunit alcohol dehydrogenase family) [Streptacidiphilus sp. MAP12-16]|uniref:SDR family NAD(P)-dependent oxidoreductase n=1 Tax=Streptacidiphilus sp. MAP12-16 TaxID=3156300 RepID=UPI00351718F9
MESELAGRTAVVTGAGRGIGLAITRALAAAGARVVAGTRSASPDLARLAETGTVEAVEVDLATTEGPALLVAQAGPALDILVNNVGAAPPRPGGFLSITDEQWLASLTVNLLAAVRTTRAALPPMIANGGGSIVNIASVNSSLPDPLVIDYSAAKAALSAFSKALSKEVGAKGIRVNTISPGPVATDLWLGKGGVADVVGGSTGVRPDDIVAAAAAATVTGRFTRPEEVADLAVMLAGPRTENVTGADFRIDGGLIPTW